MRGSRPSYECPTCHQRILIRHGVRLSPRLADIFDAIERREKAGEFEEILAVMFYGGKPKRDAYNAIKVNIAHINDKLVETCYRIGKNGRGADVPYRVLKEDEAGGIRAG